MALPWLRILDAVIGVSSIARRPSPPPEEQMAPGSRALGHLETRLAGVVVAALKEAFDRDSRRLELEREQIEAERRRAERALRLELLRQAGDREIGRLRLLAGVAVVSWLGTMFFASRLLSAGVAARVLLGSGWALLLAGLAAAMVAQGNVAAALVRIEPMSDRQGLETSFAAEVAPWLIVVGLALVGVSALVS